MGSSADENPGAVPEELRLAVEASPNPFKEQTVIAYSLPSDATVTVSIFDMNGKKIRSFEVGHQPSGAHQLAWNGTDDTGNPVTNGPYLCRVNAGDQEATSRVMVIR
jgi:flagellar hook assembly protein FlgD